MPLIKYFLTSKPFFISLLLVLFIAPSGQAEKRTIMRESTTAEYQSNLGAYYWQKGDYHQAIDAWEVEAEIYRSLGLPNSEALANLKIAQTYISLGKLEIATFMLRKLLRSVREPSIEARIWNQLGIAYSRNGENESAISAYKKSLEKEKNLKILNNLAEAERKRAIMAQLLSISASKKEETQKYLNQAKIHQESAIFYAQSALHKSDVGESPSDELIALIQWAELSPTGLDVEELERGRRILANLPNSRTKVYLGINWAKLDRKHTTHWLSQSALVAKKTGDAIAESYALLELGLLAEKSGNLQMAQDYAYNASLLAQSEFAMDSLYRSQWLAARIYERTGNRDGAISSYRNAISSYGNLSSSFEHIDVERRINFKEEIEAMYRNYLELLHSTSEYSQSKMESALYVSSLLRLEELRNYFGDNCIEISGEISEFKNVLAEKNAVMISSIILENQTHFYLQLPDGTLHHSKADLSDEEINKMVSSWYETLKQGNGIQYKKGSLLLYDLIIRPFETELDRIDPDTIVFVHDGILRNVPPAALHDGEKYLAEKWASVSSLGFNFRAVPSSPQSEVAAFGLSVERDGWSPLTFVPIEIENVTKVVKGKKFLDKDFTTDVFQKQITQERYSIVHLATHGYFGGVAENSFILAYDKSLNAIEIKDVLINSQANIDLLVFSACETAIGSNSSALGLAGVAKRSGANTVLGSYWAVKDSAQAELMKDFYFLVKKKKLSPAEAVRQIQIKQIQQDAFADIWAALNLIGDW